MKNFFDMYEDVLISAIFFICLIIMILFTAILLNAHSKLEEETVKKKQQIIICLKKQLHCYNENRKLNENETIMICGNIDFCEKN